jgi:hypothetical protein
MGVEGEGENYDIFAMENKPKEIQDLIRDISSGTPVRNPESESAIVSAIAQQVYPEFNDKNIERILLGFLASLVVHAPKIFFLNFSGLDDTAMEREFETAKTKAKVNELTVDLVLGTPALVKELMKPISNRIDKVMALSQSIDIEKGRKPLPVRQFVGYAVLKFAKVSSEVSFS